MEDEEGGKDASAEINIFRMNFLCRERKIGRASN
jgi:hypothetical protein